MSHFFAYLTRMKFIQRWGLMRNTRPENIQEHSLQVAMIAHALAVMILIVVALILFTRESIPLQTTSLIVLVAPSVNLDGWTNVTAVAYEPGQGAQFTIDLPRA